MPYRDSDFDALHLEEDCAGVDSDLMAWLAAREERRPKPKFRRAAAGAVFNRADDEPWTVTLPKR
ncbi:MAG TPA: hypothetical protein VN428_22060 [Bryobacteraceae bacterium]|nr:hypothetical protein [Bryobacteraceae bacterium]